MRTKAKDLRVLSPEELAEKGKALKKELFDLRYQRRLGQVEKPARFKSLRRDIAKVLTILNERKRESDKGK